MSTTHEATHHPIATFQRVKVTFSLLEVEMERQTILLDNFGFIHLQGWLADLHKIFAPNFADGTAKIEFKHLNNVIMRTDI